MSRYFALVFFVSLFVSSSSAQSLPEPSKFHLFLLIGQSNMAGRGKVSDADKVPSPRVMMLDKSNQWVPAVDPLHFDKPKMVGVGLGRSFAEVIAESNPDVTIGLIPCAVGGSPISSWEPGGYHGQTKSHPYDDMLKRLRVAMKSGTLKAILWHQGESDSNATKAPLYAEKLSTLIGRLRDEVGDPKMPFIAGQMGQFRERPWNDFRKQVDSVHQSLPSKVKHTAFVSSDGLNHKGDEVHFDTESYRELGRRFAKAYRKLTE